MSTLIEYPPNTTERLYSGGSLCYTSRNPKAPITLVRPIKLVAPLFSLVSLEKILEHTEEELTIVADFCQAKVVPHQWGTYYFPGSDYHNWRLDKDRILVAKVDRIQAETLQTSPDPLLSFIQAGIRKYIVDRRFSRYKLNDMKPAQFIYGTNQNTSNTKTGLFLVDIEPRYRPELGVDLY